MPGHSRAQPTPEEGELRQLRTEIKRLEMENEILKKASAYLARNQR
jgi:transposase-like protein